MASSHLIKVLTPTGYDLLEVTPDGRVRLVSSPALEAVSRPLGDVYVSETNPGLTEPGVWIELHPSGGGIKTFWIEDGL